MAEESDLERTEAPSSRRLEKAREEGQIPQSRELMAFTVMAASLAGFWILGGWLTRQAGNIVRQGLSFSRNDVFDPSLMSVNFVTLSWNGLLLMAPLFLLAIAAALATPFALGGWVLSTKALTPNFDRLNPVSGIKRLFSWNSIGELVKAILKATLIGAIIVWVVHYQQEELFALIGQSIQPAIGAFGHMVLFAGTALVVGLALIAAIDVPFQLWRYYHGLRMTKEEVRQEMKEMDGDPHLKARIRSQQREMARKRMMSEIPKADVVVTNPTHFAIALKYDRETMQAPVVVAKGMNLLAGKIRELAQAHQIPVVEAPPLARALYRHTELGDQIPATLYTAVAEIMAYVYQLNHYMAAASAGQAMPTPPSIVVPAHMDPPPVGIEA